MLIMVGYDLARAENALCSRVRGLVADLQPAINVDKIVLNARHNHGAPCVQADPELAAELAIGWVWRLAPRFRPNVPVAGSPWPHCPSPHSALRNVTTV